MPRAEFVQYVRMAVLQPTPRWEFSPVYWRELFPPGDDSA
jgi:hypothetical protein